MIAIACMANWFAWALISICLGGDALGVKPEGGRYFLSSHGRYREVSRGVFTYSRLHGYTAFTGLGIAGLVAIAGHRSRQETKPNETPNS
jgi:hypothetical protein